MKHIAISSATLLLLTSLWLSAEPITAESVKALTEKVANWQPEHFHEHGKYRALAEDPARWQNRKN